MLIRDPEAKARWHQQYEATKDRDDGPSLYVSGEGETFDDAMADAEAKALAALPIETPNVELTGAGTNLVHAECEAAECARASAMCQGNAWCDWHGELFCDPEQFRLF